MRQKEVKENKVLREEEVKKKCNIVQPRLHISIVFTFSCCVRFSA